MNKAHSPAGLAVAVAVVIAAHGLVHLMDVALLWKLGRPGQLRYADALRQLEGAAMSRVRVNGGG
jgi:hypothetical protein